MTYQNANKNSHLRNAAANKESTVFPQLPFSQKYIIFNIFLRKWFFNLELEEVE